MSVDRLIVAAVQTHAASADPAENLRDALALCDTAADAGAQLLVLPELFVVQYAPFAVRDPSLLELAEPLDGPTVTALAGLARRRRVWIVAPIYERAMRGVAYDTAVLIDDTGTVRGAYRKTHVALLAQPNSGQEKYFFREGHEFPVWDTPWGKLGILICYDRNFPEAWRMLVERGAEIVAVPITTDGRSMFREVAQVMCYLNGVFGIFANRVGEEGARSFFGGSLICGARGEILAEAEAMPTAISTTLPLGELGEIRAAMPFLRDLRPEIYAAN